jgi:hypothetical protein
MDPHSGAAGAFRARWLAAKVMPPLWQDFARLQKRGRPPVRKSLEGWAGMWARASIERTHIPAVLGRSYR